MRIEMLQSVDGDYLPFIRALVVTKDDTSKPCENCGKRSYTHKLLAKEDNDWCLNCNDEHYRKGWTEIQMGVWCMEQMTKGMAVAVVTQDREE
tara:strand:+ start:114 stop:392 length:279 start_codon:yes stop_codon:yes gene_type:complete